jgi:hypothetical protein
LSVMLRSLQRSKILLAIKSEYVIAYNFLTLHITVD